MLRLAPDEGVCNRPNRVPGWVGIGLSRVGMGGGPLAAQSAAAGLVGNQGHHGPLARGQGMQPGASLPKGGAQLYGSRGCPPATGRVHGRDSRGTAICTETGLLGNGSQIVAFCL